MVADIVNCRILEIAPDKHIVRTLGQTGACRDNAPTTYGDPNGDTPLPDGGLLITEIYGSRVVRLSSTGKVLFDIHVPVAYPSDAQLDSQGNVIVVDYSNPGAVVAVTQQGRLLWRYGPATGRSRMDHPSLGTPLPNGDIVINDDARDRIIVLDPTHPADRLAVRAHGRAGDGRRLPVRPRRARADPRGCGLLSADRPPGGVRPPGRSSRWRSPWPPSRSPHAAARRPRRATA